MHPIPPHEAEDGMVIDVVGQRQTVTLNTGSYDSQMSETALLLLQGGAHDQTGVVVLGHYQRHVLFQGRNPSMYGSVMLIQSAYFRHLESDIALLRLVRSRLVVSLSDGKSSDTVSMKRMSELSVGFLSQQSEVEDPSKGVGLVSDVGQLLREEVRFLFRILMEAGLGPGIQLEVFSSTLTLQPSFPEHIESIATDIQQLSGRFLGQASLIELLEYQHHELK